jgi:hypothetical protein
MGYNKEVKEKCLLIIFIIVIDKIYKTKRSLIYKKIVLTIIFKKEKNIN